MNEPFDPEQKVELALLRAEHQKRFQVMINYVKDKVGEGTEYRNSVVRVVCSETGVYYELIDLPEEFSGVVGDGYTLRFVAPEETLKLLAQAVDVTDKVTKANTAQYSVLILYTRRGLVDRKNCYVYDFRPEPDQTFPTPQIIGAFQPETEPIFYKIKLNAGFAEETLGIGRGVVFGMALPGDRHLMVTIPYEGDQVTDLANMPVTKTIH